MFPLPLVLYEALPAMLKGFYHPVSLVKYSASPVTETKPHQTK